MRYLASLAVLCLALAELGMVLTGHYLSHFSQVMWLIIAALGQVTALIWSRAARHRERS